MLASVKRAKTSTTGERCSCAWRAARPFVTVLCVLTGLVGCGGGTEAKAPSTPQAETAGPVLLRSGETPQFKFRGVDGREVSDEVALGRNTVLAFLATFDWASQAQARFLSGIERNHQPRTNTYAIVLERPENAALVESFIETLSLRYPVVHVPADKLAKTTFRGVRAVPSVWVLDSGGNVVWRSRGLATEDTLREVLRALEKRDAPSR